MDSHCPFCGGAVREATRQEEERREGRTGRVRHMWAVRGRPAGVTGGRGGTELIL